MPAFCSHNCPKPLATLSNTTFAHIPTLAIINSLFNKASKNYQAHIRTDLGVLTLGSGSYCRFFFVYCKFQIRMKDVDDQNTKGEFFQWLSYL